MAEPATSETFELEIPHLRAAASSTQPAGRQSESSFVRRDESTICLACGRSLGAELESVGAVRCQDCRDGRIPLREDLFDLQLASHAESPLLPTI